MSAKRDIEEIRKADAATVGELYGAPATKVTAYVHDDSTWQIALDRNVLLAEVDRLSQAMHDQAERNSDIAAGIAQERDRYMNALRDISAWAHGHRGVEVPRPEGAPASFVMASGPGVMIPHIAKRADEALGGHQK